MIVVTRKERFCGFNHCASPNKISPAGSLCIRILYRKEGKFRGIYFHQECFIQDLLQRWKEKELIQEQRGINKLRRNKGGKRGRPRKYTDLIKARNLLSLLSYHKDKGHKEKIAEIRKKLDELALVEGLPELF